ncbi:MAG: DUF5689 domain-containing protein [Bacteroidales bacterium]
MKNIRKIFIGLLLLGIATYFAACVKGDFDEPPIYIPRVDFTSNTTIAALKSSYKSLKQIEEDIIIQGIVVGNDESGNLYKKLIIQDSTAGIELALDKTNLYNEFKLGQRVFVKCKGMYIGDYNKLIQLGYLFEGSIGRLPEVFMPQHIFRDSLPGKVPEPQLTELTGLNTFLVSQLVKFENITFVDPGKEWAPQSADATNRSIVGTTMVVRTSKYANFASELIPAGSGTVTGILSIFQNTYQLTIRDTSDLKNFSGTVPPPPEGGDGSKEDPYTVAQAVQMQNATPYVVGFVKGFIVGSVKAGVTSIASADDIDFSPPFTSATNVLIADEAGETNFMNCVVVNLPAGSSLRGDVNLQNNPDNMGKWLNVKGTLRTYFGIAGLRDFSGEADDYEFEGGGNGGGSGSGSGTQDDPYDVQSAIEKQNANPYVVGWVKGYIVGSVKSGVTSISSGDDIHFAPPFTSSTNVLIADEKNEIDYTKCVVVNLPAGKPLRSEVNLLDHPDNLGKWLKVTGTLRTYFGIAGLRDSNGGSEDFELEEGGGSGGEDYLFVEDFKKDLGTFSTYSVAGDQVWEWADFDSGCAKMTGFVGGTHYVNEDWLISPEISLSGQTGVKMSFREAINHITSINDLKVLISTDFSGSGNPNTATWTELTGFTRAAGNSWTFIETNEVSLAAYEGQNIYIAFKYTCSSSASSTWEVGKVMLSANR